jgi:hypothetical protein
VRVCKVVLVFRKAFINVTRPADHR